MKLTELQKEDITSKNQQLSDIKPILKSEFIGIDNVIDDIIDAIRPFYIFPKSLKRPLVVCLWGMTAVGKTCLIQRIVELLNLKNKFIRFDVGEYTGSDYKLRNDLSEETSKLNTKDIIFLFDEFQFGRTINELGNEIATNSMRPVWDLLDSGKIYKWNSSSKNLWTLFKYLDKIKENEIETKNGIIINKLKQYYEISREFSSIMGCDFELMNVTPLGMNSYLPPSLKQEEKIVTKKEDYWIKISDCVNYAHENVMLTNSFSNTVFNFNCFKNPFFFKKTFIDILFQINPNFFNNNNDIFEMRKILTERTGHLSIDEIINFIKKDFSSSISFMTENDYSQSLIFCVGNIDEAYIMHESSDPDADADLFYEHSLKITVPKIKQALCNRFRMEQIGRMGNNHIIYPAFNKESYKKIINKQIKIREVYFKDEFNIDMKFTNSMHDIIYKEGVFPTQGVRPLLSTFNTMIDSYVSKIISELILKYPKTTSVSWDFDSAVDKYIFTATDESGEVNSTFSYDIKLNIDKLRKTDYSENQAFTALHESGHVVISCIKANIIPKDVYSKTAGNSEGFCRLEWPEIVTKNLLYKQIMVALGGIEAEKLIFGEDLISNGAYSDLSKATNIANNIVKSYGMGNRNYIISVAIDIKNDNAAIHDKSLEIESEVKRIIELAQSEVKKCLEENKLFLLDLTTHLSNNSKISQEELQKFALKYIDKSSIRNKDNYYNFKDIIARLKQSEEAKINTYKKPNTYEDTIVSIPLSVNYNKENLK